MPRRRKGKKPDNAWWVTSAQKRYIAKLHRDLGEKPPIRAPKNRERANKHIKALEGRLRLGTEVTVRYADGRIEVKQAGDFKRKRVPKGPR